MKKRLPPRTDYGNNNNNMNNTTTFAVIYPMGTSNSYKLFSTLSEACQFLDKESEHTNFMLPDKNLTILEVNGSIAQIEDSIYDDVNDEYVRDGEEWLLNHAIRQETVKHWRLTEVWAEKDGEGVLSFLENRYNDVQPEAENDGEVIEAWSDEAELWEDSEYDEAVKSNNPSGFLTQF